MTTTHATGGTVVAAGSLILNSATALPAGSSLTIGSSPEVIGEANVSRLRSVSPRRLAVPSATIQSGICASSLLPQAAVAPRRRGHRTCDEAVHNVLASDNCFGRNGIGFKARH